MSELSAQLERIIDSLQQQFSGSRVVWWEDPQGEFSETLDALTLQDVQILRRSVTPALAIKQQVEVLDPAGLFLIYEDSICPEPEQDWLLDIRLYAAPFAADRTSMLLQELGLRQHSLREHLKMRSAFFASKERVTRIHRLLSPDDDEAALDLKILAVLVKAEQAELFAVLTAIFATLAEAEDLENNQLWESITKFDMQPVFWQLMQKAFGYQYSEPTLRHFLVRLFATDMGHASHAQAPANLKALQLNPARAANVAVFLSQWRDSTLRQHSYDRLSKRIATDLRPSELLAQVSLEALMGISTFVDVERLIAERLRDAVLNNTSESVGQQLRDMASRRMDGYWANPRWPDNDDANRSIWCGYYRALIAASELFELRLRYAAGFSFASAEACYSAYTSELYRFDQLYRAYHEAADAVYARSPDALSPLTTRVEQDYLNGFLQPLSQKWGSFLDAGLLQQWQLPEVSNQQSFYAEHVERYLKGGEERRVFVLISDALRYEVAQELNESLNGKYRFSSELSSQLGVLPSYTKLGMASLLPHKVLSYTDAGLVQVDGLSSDGLESRNKILSGVNGLALRAEDFLNMNKTDGRELIKPYRVIYIYHNKIDAVGDSSSTESSTFSACRDAIGDLESIVSRIINNLNGHRVLVTADHGFLFQDSALEALDRSKLLTKPAGSIVSKKRYLIGRNLGSSDQVHAGFIRDTAGISDDMMFWSPKGVNRFHFVGGARFIHGGASLQEVAVPVLKVQQVRGQKAKETAIRKAQITVLGNNFTITTNRYVFNLLQTEPVSERVHPAILRVGLFDEAGEAVSVVEQVSMDSDSQNLDQRQRKVILTLLNRPFSSSERYYFKLLDTETGVEQFRIDVRINLAISNDFDF
ncbi:BREX-1 system phosphatase PglZ type A [Pseudomonas marginalis]|uniref:BREX-1 system phosphatase PglZ type A n=1 Tax=Pseudomonas TaxID=286 RepID=UPI001A175B78|nr:BREX-1 system phosphatase PglZ type A [Pseudomonas syringae pv. tomato]MBW8020434.1 BREX-1 system phosphatase PglZ type A [Pseudomonas syringae pv. tomato]